MLVAHLDLLCQPCRAIYIFLKHTKIPHTVQLVALTSRENTQPEFTKVNPFKAVPVIDDDGFLLTESVAILQYLCRKHNITDLYPTDLKEKARVEAYTHWQHLNIRYAGVGLFHSLFRFPVMNGKPMNHAKVEESSKIFKACLRKLETIFLKDTPFIYSNKLSIADLLGVCELMQPKLGLGMEELTDDYPKVNAWAERVRQEVSPEIFDEAHAPIIENGKLVKSMNLPIPKL